MTLEKEIRKRILILKKIAKWNDEKANTIPLIAKYAVGKAAAFSLCAYWLEEILVKQSKKKKH